MNGLSVEEKLKLAVEALEFYANKEHWSNLDLKIKGAYSCYNTLAGGVNDFGPFDDFKRHYAGERARRALKMIRSDE